MIFMIACSELGSAGVDARSAFVFCAEIGFVWKKHFFPVFSSAGVGTSWRGGVRLAGDDSSQQHSTPWRAWFRAVRESSDWEVWRYKSYFAELGRFSVAKTHHTSEARIARVRHNAESVAARLGCDGVSGIDGRTGGEMARGLQAIRAVSEADRAVCG